MKPVEQEFRAASVCILIESCFKKAVCSIWSLICHHFIDIVIYIFSVVICNCCCLLKDWFNKGKMSSEDTLKSVIARSIKPVTFFQFSNVKRTRKERKKKTRERRKGERNSLFLKPRLGTLWMGEPWRSMKAKSWSRNSCSSGWGSQLPSQPTSTLPITFS